MEMPLCSRCNKNIAVLFISKIENGKTEQEGICIKCAKSLGINPLDGMMEKFGMTKDEADAITAEMENGFENFMPMLESIGGENGDMSFIENLFSDKKPSGDDIEKDNKAEDNKKDKDTKSKRKKDDKKIINTYCQDLTAKARDGKIDKIIGRDNEIRRVVQILNRRQKNNPCLIGEPGVGKTAIAEGLALKIIEGDVPYKLQDKEIFLLDLTALVAGTQFRGQFESRIKGLIDEVRRNGNIILVIDEVHNLVGAGDSEGAMNAANILKPALSRGEIQVIGATTFTEYRKNIEKDTALERRFQPVTVNEPTIDEAIDILKGIKTYYETYHKVIISDEMCRKAVILSEKYITDRFLPDKAIDLIDEACSAINLANKDLINISKIEGQLTDINNQRDIIAGSEQTDDTYAKLAKLKSLEIQLNTQLTDVKNKINPVLTVEYIADVIELWTKIPASKICGGESKRLLKLSDRLSQIVIGQAQAVDAVSLAIKRSRAGISAHKKPVSFIFVGPTGVGKTELVKAVSEDLFTSKDSLIRLDMSEYMEKHAVSKIVGSPPGYVGYDDAGQLTERVRRRPYSVILFDEIEKAHPDILNIMLQILDDGRITDAQGRVVNFENTIIVLTSNAGSHKTDTSVGFGKTLNEQSKEKAIKALESFMRPEFINRIDEIIVFNQLTKDDFINISKLMISELEKNLLDMDITLSISDEIYNILTDKSFSTKYGARNIRRTIQKEIEDKIAMLMIQSEDVKAVSISVENDEIVVK